MFDSMSEIIKPFPLHGTIQEPGWGEFNGKKIHFVVLQNRVLFILNDIYSVIPALRGKADKLNKHLISIDYYFPLVPSYAEVGSQTEFGTKIVNLISAFALLEAIYKLLEDSPELEEFRIWLVETVLFKIKVL